MPGSQLGNRSAGGEAAETERGEVLQVAFDADVEVLEILAHDDEVDTLGMGERATAAG
jgi:hypothetical protein